MDQLLQHLVNALVLGGAYALLGIGLTLIFGIMNVVNFTHGALYTFGAYAMYIASASLGMNFFLALPFAIVAGLALGALIELTLLRPLRGADIDTTMLVMIGAGIILQSGTLWVFGGVAKAIPSPFPDQPLSIGPASISWIRLFVFCAALALIVGAYALINGTRLGRAMRATFQDSDTAALMGVNVRLIYTATFAIGSRPP
ncbi:branched-chain amino acid ABC transporter permease, partial [Hansschlegelia zhihuaiae]|uniref:branched-chain amino acid ABC transporter permease n=1 Tax=Hansschlegelia zhihuaiae TaxID=405005 RepID=UPI001FE19EB6